MPDKATDKTGQGPTPGRAMANLSRVAVVLVRPRIPENIGAAARAMKNTGIHRLIVVEPQSLDLNRAAMMATKGALDIIRSMAVADNLRRALAPFSFVAGTTARTGGHRQTFFSLEQLGKQVIDTCIENDVALVFGPEDAGLTNADIRFCHTMLTIPTAGFSSLNLAQAVLLVCYEIFRAAHEPPKAFVPRLAQRYELDGMYDHLKEVLVRIGFINPQNPDYWLDNLRRFFSRLPLTAKEVKVIRGICRQMDWYTKLRLEHLNAVRSNKAATNGGGKTLQKG